MNNTTTIREVIDRVDAIKPNQYSVSDKVRWLSYFDGLVVEEVLKDREGYDHRYDDFTGYDDDHLDTGLVIPFPYYAVYELYLKMKIDEENGEISRYNNSAAMFNSMYDDFKADYMKKHKSTCNIHLQVYV